MTTETKTNDAPSAPVYTLEAAPVAPFAAASVAATTVWIEAGKSLTSAYLNHIAALAILSPVATATEIMSQFTHDCPASKTKGSPAVTKSQIGRVLKDSATLADVRRATFQVVFAGMSAEDFAKCVEGASTVLRTAMNAVKHAPTVVEVVAPAGNGLPDGAPATDMIVAPDAPDALTLTGEALAIVAKLVWLAMDGDANAVSGLTTIAAQALGMVEAEPLKIAA